MHNKLITLLCLLLITTILFLCLGAYLKYEVLAQFGLFGDKNLLEVPFAILEDPAARFALESLRTNESKDTADEPSQAQTEPEIVINGNNPMKSPPLLLVMEPPTEPPYVEVTEQWFDDVLFIGDSRTVGLRDYARLGSADYFCCVGMTVFDACEQLLEDKDFASTNLVGLLSTKRYNKIYISLGLNECGYPYELLMEGYASLVDTVKSHQPDAVIILQAMITVSTKKASSKWCFELWNIQKVNEGIRALADGQKILYIDANEHFADEKGYLPSDLTPDGCHFYISGYQEWAKWIFENAKTLNISFG